MKVGVISDTHGLLRGAAIEKLRGCDLIVHAGDVGNLQILEKLRKIGPVYTVRGNVDQEEWADQLPTTEIVEVGGVSLYVLHNLAELDLVPGAAGFQAVIFGHSHLPSIEWRSGVLYLNPGSAGPRRFNRPVSMALLEIKEGQLHPQLIELGV
jgi:uncharacterized protein